MLRLLPPRNCRRNMKSNAIMCNSPLQIAGAGIAHMIRARLSALLLVPIINDISKAGEGGHPNVTSHSTVLGGRRVEEEGRQPCTPSHFGNLMNIVQQKKLLDMLHSMILEGLGLGGGEKVPLQLSYCQPGQNDVDVDSY